MKSPHFFKAYCRVGIHNFPHGQNEPATGVEKAPNFILSQEFLAKFPNSQTNSFTYGLPQVLDSEKNYRLILSDTRNFRNFLNKGRDKKETQVVVGGDHCITFASTLSDIDTFGSNIGFIHFDSHGDINLYNESPSKNFHGMYIRALVDTFDLEQFDKLVPNKIPTDNLLFIGDLELDEGEKTFFTKYNLPVISHRDINDNPDQSLNIIQEFINKHEHIHISFDVDVFNRSIVPATGTPSQDGFQKEPVFEILKVIKKAKSLTLDVAEVNPEKEGADATIKLAQEIILEVLS